jgi:hypothetical protein
MERIQQFLNIPKAEIGCFSGAKKTRTGIIDIAVMQSVGKKGTVAEWVKDYGQIIVPDFNCRQHRMFLLRSRIFSGAYGRMKIEIGKLSRILFPHILKDTRFLFSVNGLIISPCWRKNCSSLRITSLF